MSPTDTPNFLCALGIYSARQLIQGTQRGVFMVKPFDIIERGEMRLSPSVAWVCGVAAQDECDAEFQALKAWKAGEGELTFAGKAKGIVQPDPENERKSEPTKSTKPMSKKTTKTKSETYRLVKFSDLAANQKGGGVGSAWEVVKKLSADGHKCGLGVKDVNRHQYVLGEDGAICGVAAVLEVDEAGMPMNWDVPRDIRLWQQMKVAAASDSPSPIADSKGSLAAGILPARSLDGPLVESGRVLELAVDDVGSCPLNPRQFYDDARTAELAENIKGVGIIHALLVRPAPGWEPGTMYEVIAGHRRLMAARLAGLKTVPVVVREISDEMALVLMMSENLQRADISPIEEAKGYEMMLALEAAGAKIYTAKSLGEKLGKSAEHIGKMVRLLRLPPAAVKALNAGTIGAAVGSIIARVPGEKMRAEAAKKILAGLGDGPLNSREAEDLIRREFVAELRNVAFDRKDAKLFPEQMDSECQRIAGGACDGCPFSEAARGKIPICTNLECFREKVRLHVDGVKHAATQAGSLVVEGKLAEKYLYHDGTVKAESAMVKVTDAPPASEVNGTKKAPTWKAMLDGKGAKLTVVIDAKGNAHELVERRVALAVAKSNGYADLLDAQAALSTASAAQSGEGRDTAAAARAEAEQERERKDGAAKEKAKLEKLTTAAALDALIVEVGIHFAAAAVPNKKVWPALIELALTHAGSESELLVCSHRKLDKSDAAKAIRDYAAGLVEKGESQRLPGLFVELLLAGLMKHAGVGCKAFAELAKALAVDVGEIKAAVKAEVAEKKKGAVQI